MPDQKKPERSVTPPSWVTESLDAIYNWVQDIEDIPTRVEAAAVAIDMVKDDLEFPLARLRASDVRELHAAGWSYSSLSEAFDLSRARIGQIVTGE